MFFNIMKNKLLRYIELIFVVGIMNFSCINNKDFEERRGEKEYGKIRSKGSKVTDAKKTKSPKKQKSLAIREQERKDWRQDKINTLNNQAERLALVIGILIKKNYKFKFLKSRKENIKTKTFFKVVEVLDGENNIVFDAETEKNISEKCLNKSTLQKNKRDYSFNMLVGELNKLYCFPEHRQYGRTATMGCGIKSFDSIRENDDFRSFNKKDCSKLGSELHKLFLNKYYLAEKTSRCFTLNFSNNPSLIKEIDAILEDKIKKH